ncbi:hypothetical protein [Haloferax sp. KTX1]|uniref:hypothetical protein n=1 Tax=Haloferax sp. KTX1 TaxID=2600597 RepID=UPI0011DD1ED7|nr:hypothetical protein [Haloferax sp. KTX1]
MTKMSQTPSSEDGNDPKNVQFTRRDTLKKSALLSSAIVSGGFGTTALVGTAAAAGGCSDEDPQNIDEAEYVWEKGDYNIAKDQTCDNLADTNLRDVHAMDLVYRGSCWDGAVLHHYFGEAGHVEHYEQTYPDADCDGTWDSAYGVAGHRITVNSNRSSTFWNKPAGGNVGGFPEDSSGSGGNPTERELAFTAISAALGYWGPTWVGVASSIVLAMIPESHGNSNFDSYSKLMFDWDYSYSNGPKCGSHFVNFTVESNSESNDTVSLDVQDEAWGEYPNYSQITKQVDFVNDTQICSNVSGLSADDERSDEQFWAEQSSHSEPPKVGTHIETSKGERAKVKNVSVNTTRMSCSSTPKIMEAGELPNGIADEFSDKQKVTYMEFPARVREIKVHANITDE